VEIKLVKSRYVHTSLTSRHVLFGYSKQNLISDEIVNLPRLSCSMGQLNNRFRRIYLFVYVCVCTLTDAILNRSLPKSTGRSRTRITRSTSSSFPV
jgi:hypothetical protein